MRGTLIVFAHRDTFELLASERHRFYGHRTRLWERLQAAWLVFSGQADALMWNGEKPYGETERRSEK